MTLRPRLIIAACTCIASYLLGMLHAGYANRMNKPRPDVTVVVSDSKRGVDIYAVNNTDHPIHSVSVDYNPGRLDYHLTSANTALGRVGDATVFKFNQLQPHREQFIVAKFDN